MREPGDKAYFWRSYLVPVDLTSQVALPSEDLVCTGVFEVWPIETDGLFFGGDASGCPYIKDARIRKVSYAVAAVKWDDVGTMIANIDQLSQTVPYAEVAVLRVYLQATVEDVVFAADASYVIQRARSDIWNDRSERCVKVLKV